MQAQTLKYKNLINNKAALWTIGVHVVLLLLFILIKYSSPVSVAAVPDMGMEVNLGTDADGSGDDQPMAMGDPAADRSARQYHAPAQNDDAAKDIMQSDDADAPAIKPVQPNTAKHNSNAQTEKNTSRNNNQRQQTANNTPHVQPQRPKYTYAGSSGSGGNGAVMDKPGTGEGNTTGNGDRGVPGGTPGAANYTGNPGSGNGGFAVSGLGDRTISPAVFKAEFHEGGKVIAQVTVERDGTISNIRIKSSPSEELTRIAKQKLSQARFTRSSSSEPQQFGTVTIIFKARS